MFQVLVFACFAIIVSGQAGPNGSSTASNGEYYIPAVTRVYAYAIAFLVLIIFGLLVYFHVISIRKERLMEQIAEQGLYAEWSPLIDTKIVRPPPYEQVV